MSSQMRYAVRFAATIVCVDALSGNAAAQNQAAASTDPNTGNITVTGSFDTVSTYVFRGIRQNSTGIALWPAVDLGFAAYSADGRLKSVAINLGSWNSLNTGDTGSDGPTGKLWYESDFYSKLTIGFSGSTSLAAFYTAYTSPNNTFTTVKEIAFQFSLDDSAYLGRAALKPYALVAVEFGAAPGIGQADGGAHDGRYLELGIAPGYSFPRAFLTMPVKVGVSLHDYYELNVGTPAAPVFEDNPFGYASVAALVTVPLGGTTTFGDWNVHGGVEFLTLGETTKALNGGDGHRVVGSIGFGFAY
jgi:hypothetical protein